MLVDVPDPEGGASLMLFGGAVVSSRGVQQRLSLSLDSLLKGAPFLARVSSLPASAHAAVSAAGQKAH